MAKSPGHAFEDAPAEESYRPARELADQAPTPAVWMNLRTGTAGWTDPTLIRSGAFYPAIVKSAEGRLRHYAEHFSMVEVDATYYALIAEETAARWVDWTPPNFRFHVKAHPVVTGHPIDTHRLPKDLREAVRASGAGDPTRSRVYPDQLPEALRLEIEQRFVATLRPLLASGKLGAVLAQFPPWFTATRGNARRVEELAMRFPELPISVEFRHVSWTEGDRRERVFDLLRAHGYAYVIVDEPPTKTGGVPSIFEVTNPDLAVVRFHGRNVAGWNQKGASVHERFNYLYSPAELSSFREPLRHLHDQVKEVHAVFNNCVRDFAVVGAKGLVATLSQGLSEDE